MCQNTITLSKNEDGHLVYCKTCKVRYLYFKNLYLEFTDREFKAFQRYVSEIDVRFWQSCPKRVSLKRKIPIPTMQRNLTLIFNQQELKSLKDIVFEDTAKPNTPVGASEIDYIQILN